MHPSKKKAAQAAAAPDRSGCLATAIQTGLVILVIVYGSLLLISRTEGFRYVVEERLQERWAWPVRVTRVWLRPDLSLVIEDIRTEDFSGEGPGLRIGEMRLGWRLADKARWYTPTVRSVHMDRALWSFARDAESQWQPAGFAADALWLSAKLGLHPDSAESPADEPRYMNSEMAVRIQGSDLLWWNSGNEPVGSLLGVEWQQDQAVLLGSTVRHMRMGAEKRTFRGHAEGAVTQTLLFVDDRIIPAD